jgi:hypothetical protein
VTDLAPDLASRIQQGSLDALEELYRAIGADLVRLAIRMTRDPAEAADVVHDVFVGLPAALARYEERGQLVAWLRRVTAEDALARLPLSLRERGCAQGARGHVPRRDREDTGHLCHRITASPVARTRKTATPARGSRTMIKGRWRSTRDRLNQKTGNTDTTGLWSRIDASRRAGKSVDLPASDPRRPVSPVLLGVLAVAAVVTLGTLRDRSAPAPIAAVSSDTDDAAFDWLTTPAYAQGNGRSDLPPIDPPDLSRMTPNRLTYQHMGGADGFITQKEGTDTFWVARDTVGDAPRVLLSRTDRKGNRYSDTDALDSLALAGDGHLLFWRWQVTNLQGNRLTTVGTTLLTDSVRFSVRSH